jgi:hypothetical protein
VTPAETCDTPDVSPSDLRDAAARCRGALEPLVDRDWSAAAGDLAWDVRTTVAHACDALGWYAAHLAVGGRRRLRVDLRIHDDATNAEVLEVLDAASAMLAQVAITAPPEARAYHSAGMADVTGFLGMGCDEVLVHGWDACQGLGSDFVVPPGLADRVLRRLFPWAPTDVAPWPALLWANGRIDLPGRRSRLGPDWLWHCAPLDEWDGAIPRWDGSAPGHFEWDAAVGRWRAVMVR